MLKLVKFSRDWADEFQAEGFIILSAEDVEKLDTLVSEGNFEWYFGTNEGFEAGDIEMTDFEITDISEEEALFLERLFPDARRGFGQIFDASFIEEALLNTTE